MPLLDHFRAPLDERYSWESFHSGWATRIADQLTDRLPPDFVAMEHTHFGSNLEIDVATFERSMAPSPLQANGPATATSTEVAASWAPPSPTCVLPAVFLDTFEVRVFSTVGGLTLVGAIELISPGNKDRPHERRAFATKCASYLHQGVSLIIIDIVTTRRANLHNEIVGLMASGTAVEMPTSADLYAVAYRPVLRQDRPEIDIWIASFAVGQPLPTMPLRLTGDLFVPVAFEGAYEEACRRRRLA